MTSCSTESAHAVPGAWGIARLSCAVAAGAFVALLLQLGMAFLLAGLDRLSPAVLSLPLLLLPALLALAWWGPSCFIGGAIARAAAGEQPREGWIGAASALTLLFAIALVQAFGGWGFTIALEEPTTPVVRHGDLVRDYTALIQLGITVIGTASAWCGDRWMLWRLRREP